MGGFLDYFTAVRVEFEARRKVTIECDKVLNMARGVIKLITEIDVFFFFFFFGLLIKFQHLIHVDGFETIRLRPSHTREALGSDSVTSD